MDQPELYDVCIVGGGIAGCIVARDVVSTGNLRCIILERDASIGGVWAHNDYQGLRLHGLGAPYRSWSLAPRWQKGEGSEDNLYRPTRAEMFEYVHSLVDHESIVVKTNSEYTDHCESEIQQTGHESLYEVTFQDLSTGQGGSISSRVVVFATGAVSTLGGEPNLPIDIAQVTNGARIIHSSQMSSLDETTLNEVDNIYVVGSSKAAIDVLHHFLSTNEQHNDLVAKTRWAHRGHVIFTKRESMEGWMISPNPICQRARSILFRIGSWLCYHQMVDSTALISGGWGDMTVIGSPLAKVLYRGGIEDEGVLDSIRSTFVPSQLLLRHQNKQPLYGNTKSIVLNSEGILELHAQDGTIVEVEQNDLVIFCTGQRREHDNSWRLDPNFNSAGIFTVHGYCQMQTVSAVLTAGLIISYLDGTNETIYSSGYLVKQACRVSEQLERAKDKSAWAMTMSYLGGMFLYIQPSLTPKIIGDLSFDHRWQSDWFGKDLDVTMDLLPIVTITTTCC